MEHIHALLLIFLETTFIFVALGMLYSQRRTIGKAPFYMSLGLLFVFFHFISAAEIRAVLYGGQEFEVGYAVVYLPILTAFLMVYITEGTLAAQRLIIGAAVLFGFSLYLGELTRLQCNWLGFSLSSGADAVMFEQLLDNTRDSMNIAALVLLFDLLLIPIFFTRLKNFGFPRFLCIVGSVFCAMLLAALLKFFLGRSFSFDAGALNGNFIIRVPITLWLGGILAVYLNKIEVDVKSGEKSPLDILFAFVGSYSRSKELEENLKEWTNRYRQVLENAGEMIVTLTSNGRILDANYAAVRLLGGQKPEDVSNRLLFPRMRILDRDDLSLGCELKETVRFRCRLDEYQPGSKLLSCTLSPIKLRGQTLLVMVGRDITEEMRLAEEKARLSEQLIHSQRIESLGMLAGGIAHDFNNHMHAILGHIDLINFMHRPEDPEVVRHLEKVAGIAEQAGHLTGQLLGFARKGKYQVADLDPGKVLRDTLELLGPRKQRDLVIRLEIPENLPPVHGDAIQLQQVMLNLMLNAIDAMEGNPGESILTIEAGLAVDAPIRLEPPPERAGTKPEDYLFIRISDNGCGMDADTQKRLFEPFFTTKPVGKGTGMGLAMVYGTVSSHQGWVQFKSAPGKGTHFYLFLPVGGKR